MTATLTMTMTTIYDNDDNNDNNINVNNIYVNNDQSDQIKLPNFFLRTGQKLPSLTNPGTSTSRSNLAVAKTAKIQFGPEGRIQTNVISSSRSNKSPNLVTLD